MLAATSRRTKTVVASRTSSVGARLARQLVVDRQRDGPETALRRLVRLGVRRGESIGDDRQLMLRALECAARTQPSDGGQHARLTVLNRARVRSEWTCRGRHVDVVLARELRHRRQHTNHGVDAIVHLERAADDAKIGAEGVLPIGVADDQDGGRVLRVVFGSERPAEERGDAEHVEEVGRDDAGLYARRFAVSKQTERHLVVFDDRVE